MYFAHARIASPLRCQSAQGDRLYVGRAVHGRGHHLLHSAGDLLPRHAAIHYFGLDGGCGKRLARLTRLCDFTISLRRMTREESMRDHTTHTRRAAPAITP